MGGRPLTSISRATLSLARRPSLLAHHLTRRQFLGLGAAAAAAASLGFVCVPPPPSPPVPARGRVSGPRHLAWVWQFSRDGPPDRVVSVLAQHNLGILLKTHDGTEWMSTYDASLYSVWGPDQVAVLANYFETYGVPFHAWCVIRGLDPRREAEMCAQVIAAGARSVTVDLEPHAGFWVGTPAAAVAFGEEFRRRQPDATLHISVDPRPWVLVRVPVGELAHYAQGFAPQLYWDTFNTSANHSLYRTWGFPVGAEGITPAFLVEATADLLERHGLPMQPAGQGAASGSGDWSAFLRACLEAASPIVSVWRYGVTPTAVWELLRDGLPRIRRTRTPTSTATPSTTPTRTPRPTRTRTPTPTSTNTGIPAPSETATPTRTATVPPSPTVTSTPSPTETAGP